MSKRWSVPATSATLRPSRRWPSAFLDEFKDVEVLVNAAGTNAPRRALEVLSLDDYHAMINTNLNGAYYCTQAFLPQMRARKSRHDRPRRFRRRQAGQPQGGTGLRDEQVRPCRT